MSIIQYIKSTLDVLDSSEKNTHTH